MTEHQVISSKEETEQIYRRLRHLMSKNELVNSN
jgi:hypothetical protein